MRNSGRIEGMLSPYRALDLTDEKGLLCGKLLGDLGADVIKVEKPGGDPARMIGPFYHDEVDSEKSLFWWAFNTSKRGITLDIESHDSKETFKKLIEKADFVIESFPPGYMDSLGLGYQELGKINPGIILISISPFGQTGPYRDYKATDIVVWAMGGLMYQYGDIDRPPIRIGHHSQAYLHAGAEAAAAAMLALHHREATGQGQYVDVSIQEAVARCTTEAHTALWDMTRVVRTREGILPGIRITEIWPCKDGFVAWRCWSGAYAKRWNQPLIDWIKSEGMADDFLKGINWDNYSALPEGQETPEQALERMRQMSARIVRPVGKFFLAHTKAELLEGAVERRVMLYPVSSTDDILNNVQLAARGYWTAVEHPELGAVVNYPGSFARPSEAVPIISRRAPLIGEHNREIQRELEISKKNPAASRQPKAKQERQPGQLLAGITVADFGFAWAGPLTTKTLADYGAQVIRIEGRNHPEVFRTLAPFKDSVPGLNRSGTFNQDNTGKLSIALNLANPRGVAIAKRIVAQSDIVLENFASGVMEKMGLGYEELKKMKQDIVMLSSCMQGHTGPYAAHPGYGFLLTPLSGFNQIGGWPDRKPVEFDSYTDFIAPHFNVLIILAALDYRRRTGKGQCIDMSQFETGIQFLAPLMLEYTTNRRIAQRVGNRCAEASPHGAFRCRGQDRWCVVSVTTDEEWRNLCRVMGRPDWTRNSRLSTFGSRKANEDELERLIEGWTLQHSAEEVMEKLQASGVAAGVVQTGEDLLDHDPQLKHRQFFRELDHPEVVKYRAPGPSFRLSKCPFDVKRAPLLGEHNEYVLKDLLGISEDEISELVLEGVVE